MNFPMTGVINPISKVSREQVQLASGWLLAAIGLIILVFIVFFKRKLGKRKKDYSNLIKPASARAFQKSYLKIKATLMKKGLSENEAKEYVSNLLSEA